MHRLSIARLFDDHRDRLKLEWVAANGVDRCVELKNSGNYGAEVIGHLNLIHPGRIQVLGHAEIQWAIGRSSARMRLLMDKLLAGTSPAIFVADGADVPPAMREACEATATPLFSTPMPCAAIIDLLRLYLVRNLADTTSVHGVFLDVLGMGVMVTGDSGVGKSELALELISRGHGLVADDVVELVRTTPTTVEGRCPGMLRDFLEVRGLGLLNIRTIFGEIASRRKMKLTLIVNLQRASSGAESPRLPLDAQTQDVLGVPIRKVIIPVAAGRNLAVLLEAAVRNTILQMRGIDSMKEFIDRQQHVLLHEDY